MKAERRHELKSNDLAWSLENLPLLLQRHANKILLVVIAVALVVILVRYRSNAAYARGERVKAQMAAIRTGLTNLQSAGNSPDQDWIATNRTSLATEISTAIDGVLNDSDVEQPNVLAEATVARGDLYWHLANAPALPGASTRPSLALPQPPDEYLKKAQTAYERVVTDYPGQAPAWTAAQFGLAAIAENRRNWDAAREHYTKIQESKDAATAFKDLARMRTQMLGVIDKPAFIGSLHPTTTTAPTTLSTTSPSNSWSPVESTGTATVGTAATTMPSPTTSVTTAPTTQHSQ